MQQVLDSDELLINKPSTSSKVVFWLLAVLFSTFISAVYGYLHNQISYAVSYQFFNEVIFPRFAVETGLLPPINQSAVGWIGVLSTWCVGLIAGAVLATIGLFQHTLKQMFTSTAIAIFITIAIAFTIGLIGLVLGKFILSDGNNYTAASTMHDASYVGGAVGLLVGSAYSWRRRILA